ncbi:A-kinase anchor protein 7-like isoform X3 [Rhinichthys klamathensis goyatoka]|uniref:A-kinase anchor protein 7-like isoform X3 n=1 Tax=Rhinichthys klamathensis goyatoka TaxID=3034132 RepID=UPI0024B51DCD|nr:A-kinase anchor protein 7-like isoform X3 [Rhinichthys klamathensis goyatoka]
MISRHFLLATRLKRWSGVLNAGVPSEVIKCVSEVGLRVISQSSRATQIIISQSHTPSVSVCRAGACAEGQASIMEDNNNNSVSTLTARQHTDTTKDVKTVNKAKKEPRKASGKKKKQKQKQKEEEEAECLMCELPFTDAGVWRDLGFAGSESSVKKKKRKRGDGSRVESEEDGEKKKKKEAVARPNYFISVPITNPEIKQAVQDMQKLVLEKDPRLSRALIPVDTLHITLLVAHLKTQEQVDLAVSTLSALESPLNTLLAGHRLILPFCGVGHFKQEVAFVQIAEGEPLNTLALIAESVRKAFEERGIVSGDDKAFKPHLTFLKLSRAPKLRKQGVKKLDPALFSDFESRVFGDECVCRVDLCSMLKKKTSDGYYHREKSVTFRCVCTQRRMDQEGERGRTQVQAIKTLLAQENTRAKILQELNLSGGGTAH